MSWPTGPWHRRRGLAAAKEFDRTQQEKAELVKRIHALALGESTLEAQLTSIPELHRSWQTVQRKPERREDFQRSVR